MTPSIASAAPAIGFTNSNTQYPAKIPTLREIITCRVTIERIIAKIGGNTDIQLGSYMKVPGPFADTENTLKRYSDSRHVFLCRL